MRIYIFFFSILILAAASSVMAQNIEQKVFVPPLKENSSRYFYVPFDVPQQTKSISISYNYDKRDGANTLDLGVFDEKFDETFSSVKGFRGWSGGRRNEIFIAENSATNGYLGGKIQSGKWRVILGLYKVAPEGVEVNLTVKFNDVKQNLFDEPQAEENQSFVLPALEKFSAPEINHGYKWFRGDLHVHTYHSDGKWTFPLIFDWAEKAGFDFLGLTDHNTASHHFEIDKLAEKHKNLLILRGEEVTTYGGHYNVWGLPAGELIDFRMAAGDVGKLRKSIDRVHKLGLVASINHPTATCGGCDWSYGDWKMLDSVEIWNGFWDATDEKAVKIWDEQLQKGLKISVIGSSDTHNPPLGNPVPIGSLPLGKPMTYLGMKNLSQKDFFAAIKAGRAWISDEPKNYKLSFSAADGEKVYTIGDSGNFRKSVKINFRAEGFPANSVFYLISNGQKIHQEEIKENKFSFSREIRAGNQKYFRIEIRQPNGRMIALTNPIYVKQ